MNDKQTNALNVLRRIQGVADSYESEVSQYPIVQQKVQELNELVNMIEAQAKNTALPMTGVTKTKGQTKRHLAELGSELAAAGAAYASDQKDLQLAGIFKVSNSDIRYAKDEDALNIAEMLVDELEKLPEAVRTTYLIATEDVDTLRHLAEEFRSVSKVQGSKSADSKSAHRQLNILFDRTATLLRESLDKLMLRLRRKESELVEAYFNARGKDNMMLDDEGPSGPPPPVDMT